MCELCSGIIVFVFIPVWLRWRMKEREWLRPKTIRCDGGQPGA